MEDKNVYCCQLFVFEIKLNANSKIKIKNFGKNLGKASVNDLKEADVHKTGRSSRCSVKTRKRQKAVLKNFAKITGKYMCCNLFNKITGGGGVGGASFLNKNLTIEFFSSEFSEIFHNSFLLLTWFMLH